MRKVSTLLLFAGCLAIGATAAEGTKESVVTVTPDEVDAVVAPVEDGEADETPVTTPVASTTLTGKAAPAASTTPVAPTGPATTTPAAKAPALVATTKAKNMPVRVLT